VSTEIEQFLRNPGFDTDVTMETTRTPQGAISKHVNRYTNISLF